MSDVYFDFHPNVLPFSFWDSAKNVVVTSSTNYLNCRSPFEIQEAKEAKEKAREKEEQRLPFPFEIPTTRQSRNSTSSWSKDCRSPFEIPGTTCLSWRLNHTSRSIAVLLLRFSVQTDQQPGDHNTKIAVLLLRFQNAILQLVMQRLESILPFSFWDSYEIKCLAVVYVCVCIIAVLLLRFKEKTGREALQSHSSRYCRSPFEILKGVVNH